MDGPLMVRWRRAVIVAIHLVGAAAVTLAALAPDDTDIDLVMVAMYAAALVALLPAMSGTSGTPPPQLRVDPERRRFVVPLHHGPAAAAGPMLLFPISLFVQFTLDMKMSSRSGCCPGSC
ncbi:hypothetical protein [Pilimelia anulata]|uniref:hypothetical protein n=1 Tax=Pilimelia anulata TaxID=53371 RepID=UPI00166975DE|nr:hypothetical protein [Pilimelia anulata]